MTTNQYQQPGWRSSAFLFVCALLTMGCISSVTTTSRTDRIWLEPITRTKHLGERARDLTFAIQNDRRTFLFSANSSDVCQTQVARRYRDVHTKTTEGNRIDASIVYGSIATAAGIVMTVVPLAVEDSLFGKSREGVERGTMLAGGVALGTTGIVALARGAGHAGAVGEESRESEVTTLNPTSPPPGSGIAEKRRCDEKPVRGAKISLLVRDRDGAATTMDLGETTADGSLSVDLLARLSATFPGWPRAMPGLRSVATLFMDGAESGANFDLADFPGLLIGQNAKFVELELQRRADARQAILDGRWNKLDRSDPQQLRAYVGLCGDQGGVHCSDAKDMLIAWKKAAAVASCGKQYVTESVCDEALQSVADISSVFGKAVSAMTCSGVLQKLASGKVDLGEVLGSGIAAAAMASKSTGWKIVGALLSAAMFKSCVEKEGAP